MNSQAARQDDLTRAIEASERAGSIVSEHVRSIIDAAQTRAGEIERNAQQEAQEIRTDAHEAANRVLERLDQLEGRLGSILTGLRQEASSLSDNTAQRG